MERSVEVCCGTALLLLVTVVDTWGEEHVNYAINSDVMQETILDSRRYGYTPTQNTKFSILLNVVWLLHFLVLIYERFNAGTFSDKLSVD